MGKKKAILILYIFFILWLTLIPLGFLLGGKGWKVVLFGFVLSAFIEFTQYVAVLGFAKSMMC